MIYSPCKDCPDKGCGNHEHCDKYMAWKRDHDRDLLEQWKAREIEHALDEAERKRYRRRQR